MDVRSDAKVFGENAVCLSTQDRLNGVQHSSPHLLQCFLTMMSLYSASERSATSRFAVCSMGVLRPNLSNPIPDQDKDKIVGVVAESLTLSALRSSVKCRTYDV